MQSKLVATPEKEDELTLIAQKKARSIAIALAVVVVVIVVVQTL